MHTHIYFFLKPTKKTSQRSFSRVIYAHYREFGIYILCLKDLPAFSVHVHTTHINTGKMLWSKEMYSHLA